MGLFFFVTNFHLIFHQKRLKTKLNYAKNSLNIDEFMKIELFNHIGNKFFVENKHLFLNFISQ
jgi:hypothetical protein